MTLAAIIGPLIGLLLLNLLVIIHELGHFIVARRNGVEVEEFGLGFPPRMVSWTGGRGFWRCRYSLNWLPIGGFVRLKGEHNSSREPGSYGAAPLKAKLKILLAGVVANFLVGVVLLTILAATGLPRLLPAEPLFSDRQQWSIPADTHIRDRQVRLAQVAPESAAGRAGLQPGDRIVAISGLAVGSQSHWQAELAARAGERVELTVVRGRSTQAMVVELSSTPIEAAGDRYLETESSELIFQTHTWSAPLTGVLLAVQYTGLTIEGVGHALWALVSGSPETAKELVSGPIGILQIIQLVVFNSWSLLVMVVALISLSLAVMNLLPIPALDGGQALMTVWFEKVLGRPLTLVWEKRLQLAGFALIITLVLLITIFVDVPRLFG